MRKALRTLIPVLAVLAVIGLATTASAIGGAGDNEVVKAPTAPKMVPQAKLVKAVEWARREKARADRLSAVLAHRESYQQTLRLATLVYPKAPVSLSDKIMRCESGAGGGTPRAHAKNPTSSAGGRAQYLDTTWASTPEGKAGLSRFDPVAGVFAIFRHFHHGGSSSPWYASKGCWG